MMILTALEADLVEGVSAGHLGLGRVHRLAADRALGRLGRLERHLERTNERTTRLSDGEESSEKTNMAASAPPWPGPRPPRP